MTNLTNFGEHGKADASLTVTSSVEQTIQKLKGISSADEMLHTLDLSLYSLFYFQKELTIEQRDSIIVTHQNLKSALKDIYLRGQKPEKSFEDIAFAEGKNSHLNAVEILYKSYLSSEYLDHSTSSERSKIIEKFQCFADLICAVHVEKKRNPND